METLSTPGRHYSDVIMGTIASQITSFTIVYSTIYSVADQRKHRSSASLAFVRGIHRGPVNSPHKGPVTRKMFPFDDVIMVRRGIEWNPEDSPHETAVLPGFYISFIVGMDKLVNSAFDDVTLMWHHCNTTHNFYKKKLILKLAGRIYWWPDTHVAPGCHICPFYDIMSLNCTK